MDHISNHPTITCQSGFTLLEVLIAIAIFSIGFMAVGALQTGAIMNVSTSQDRTIAMEALNAQVEMLMHTPLHMDNNRHHNSVDEDGDGDAMFDLSPEFMETGNGPPPDVPDYDNTDFAIDYGEYVVSWWLNQQRTAQNQWNELDPDMRIIASINVVATVSRIGEDPIANALNRVEFVKCSVTD